MELCLEGILPSRTGFDPTVLPFPHHHLSEYCLSQPWVSMLLLFLSTRDLICSKTVISSAKSVDSFPPWFVLCCCCCCFSNLCSHPQFSGEPRLLISSGCIRKKKPCCLGGSCHLLQLPGLEQSLHFLKATLTANFTTYLYVSTPCLLPSLNRQLKHGKNPKLSRKIHLVHAPGKIKGEVEWVPATPVTGASRLAWKPTCQRQAVSVWNLCVHGI